MFYIYEKSRIRINYTMVGSGVTAKTEISRCVLSNNEKDLDK